MVSNLLMKDLQREILGQVAAGTITAAEGAARLEALAPIGTPVATLDPPAPGVLHATAPTRRVRVLSQFGSAEIVGDPSVAFAVADGPHRARQDGDTLVIEHAAWDGDGSFSFGSGQKNVVINGFDVKRRILVIRMNPNLPLDVGVQAGNVRVDGVHGSITGEVQAGNCKVSDFRGPIALIVQAGNVTADGRLDFGASTIRCEMGSVKVRLEKGSSVRITARTTMGKMSIDGAGGERAGNATIGGGAATLDCECTMGSVKVIAD